MGQKTHYFDTKIIQPEQCFFSQKSKTAILNKLSKKGFGQKTLFFYTKITQVEQFDFLSKIENCHFEVGAGIHIMVKFQANLM